MGCGSSASVTAVEHPGLEAQASKRWKVKMSRKEARAKFILDGTLPDDAGYEDELLELRVYLDDPVLLRKFGQYCKMVKDCLGLLMCWADILEFKSIDEKAIDHLNSKYLHIYMRYIRKPAVVPLKEVNIEADLMSKLEEHARLCQKAEETASNSASSYNLFSIGSGDMKKAGSSITSEPTFENDRRPSIIGGNMSGEESRDLFGATVDPTRVLDTLMHKCLVAMNDCAFSEYKDTHMYTMSTRAVNQKFNHIDPDDFEYMELLGQGGYGFVIHCKKHTTGRHYAMKIQLKVGLLDTFYDDMSRVVQEKEALASMHHPFIISMDYAFQTRSLVAICMDLGRGGSLMQALNAIETRKMPENEVRFYAAEISLALIHIHRMGMIYRDLKPQNVILCADGHIKLVDLGGVVDVGGNVLGQEEKNTAGGLFCQSMELINHQPSEFIGERDENSSHPQMGSMLRQLSQGFKLQREQSNRMQRQQSGRGPMNQMGRQLSSKGGLGLERGYSSRVMMARQQSMRGEGSVGSTGTNLVGMMRQMSGLMASPSTGSSVSGSGSGSASVPTASGERMSRQSSFSTTQGTRGGLYAPSLARTGSSRNLKLSSPPPLKRASSIMGTCGYMAPEMVVMNSQEEEEKQGYTNAVDFWSLGVTMFYLLTGQLPFKHSEVANLLNFQNGSSSSDEVTYRTKQEHSAVMVKFLSSGSGENGEAKDTVGADLRKTDKARIPRGFERLMDLSNQHGLSPEALSVCSQLLTIDETKRLGCGKNGPRQLRAHLFFKPIRWTLLSQRLVSPPKLPVVSVETEEPQYACFKDMMNEIHSEWLVEMPTQEEQAAFSTWDYVTPNILKVECGMEEELNKADMAITNPRKLSLGQSLLHGISSALLLGGAGSNSGSTRNTSKEVTELSPDKAKGVVSVGILKKLAEEETTKAP